MEWVKHFQLFLFDFDGLLVNTENLHFQAYQSMCNKYGCTLNWDFLTYCSYAHYDSTCLQNALYQEFPLLKAIPWQQLYDEKKAAYRHHLEYADNLLMPGVEKLLIDLENNNIARCVVTHSPKDQVDFIRTKHPVLNTIFHWITRSDYKEAKPNPECYQIAIERYGKVAQKIIGFEDSLRGFRALQATQALPVLISPFGKKGVEQFCKKTFFWFPTFEHMLRTELLI